MLTVPGDYQLTNLEPSSGSKRPPKKRKRPKKKVVAEPYVHREIVVGPFCSCRSFEFPHEISKHAKLRADWDWRTPEERRGKNGISKNGR